MDLPHGILRAQLGARLSSLCVELGQIEDSVLLAQIWTSANAGPSQEQPILKVKAQSLITARNEVIRTYASLSVLCGIRQEATDLIGDCYTKGATRVIEDLEHADGSQHPRNLLPGQDIPACSALFLPVFDQLQPQVSSLNGGPCAPTAILEVLVCETARIRHNNSDLINLACEVLDKYQFGISVDTTAFKEWSRLLPTKVSGAPSQSPSSRGSMRNTLSRTSSCYLLSSDDSDESMSMGIEFSYPKPTGFLNLHSPASRTMMR